MSEKRMIEMAKHWW